MDASGAWAAQSLIAKLPEQVGSANRLLPRAVRTVTEITLPRAKRPETVENGLRPGAVDNFISITVLSVVVVPLIVLVFA